MEIKFDKIEQTLVVYIVGDIDHHTSQIIKNSCNRELKHSHCKNIIFDMTQVHFMDSSGIGMIIGRYKETEIFGGMVIATGVSKVLDKIFTLSGLYKIIKCYSTTAEAISVINYKDMGGLA